MTLNPQFQSSNNLYSFPQPTTRVFPPPVIAKREPQTTDYKFPLGQLWVDSTDQNYYGLVNVTASSATWVLLASISGDIGTLTDQSSVVVSPTAGNIQLTGTTNQITTTAGSSVITWTLSSTLVLPGTLTCQHTVLLNTTGTAATSIGGSSGLVTITSGAAGLTGVGGGNTIQLFNDAAANTITLGSTTASASLTLQSGSGGNTLIAGNIAATITIGATGQTGKISIADSTGAMPAVDLMNGVAAGAQVLNIASGSTCTAAQTVNILDGATPGAAQTLNIMAGVSSGSFAQTVNILGGANANSTQTVAIQNGALAGSTGVINQFSGTIASGTYTYNLFNGNASGGTLVANVFGSTAATTAGTINLGTGACAHAVNVGSTSAGAIVVNSGTSIALGGLAASTITIGASAQTGKISIADSTAAMSAVDLMNGVATGAQVLNIASGTSASGAQTVNLLSGATPGASTTLNVMNGAGSAGTQAIAMLSTGATRAGTYNIGDGNAAHVGVIGSTTTSASLTLQAGSGATGLSLSAAGNVKMAPATNSVSGTSLTLNGRVGQATFTGQTTASGSSQAFAITNSAISGTTQAIIVTADNLGSNDAQMTITRVLQAASTLTVTLKNNGAAALNGDVHITFWILN